MNIVCLGLKPSKLLYGVGMESVHGKEHKITATQTIVSSC